MNIADGRGLKFELIISIFTQWIKSLLGSKLLEDQLQHSWRVNKSGRKSEHCEEATTTPDT
jgi:Na+-translocating ferredoxin:NAD+ oxidoreductase RnfG subunit